MTTRLYVKNLILEECTIHLIKWILVYGETAQGCKKFKSEISPSQGLLKECTYVSVKCFTERRQLPSGWIWLNDDSVAL